MIRIQPLSKDDCEQIKRLWVEFRFNPYRHCSDLSPKGLAQYYEQEIKRDPSGNFYVAHKNGRIVGFGLLERLDWDIKQFGINMGRINLISSANDFMYPTSTRVYEQLIYWLLGRAKEEEISHLSCKVDVEDIAAIHSLENKGFRLMDTLMIYCLDLRHSRINKKTAHLIRAYQDKDFEPMRKLAENIFESLPTRLYADPYLPTEGCNRLYANWFENCVNGTNADQVFIAEVDAKPVGFIACKIQADEPEYASIPLNAVQKEFSRRGIYTDMLHTTFNWLRDKKILVVKIRTPINSIAVQKAWLRLGARIESAHHTFHKWLGLKQGSPQISGN